MASAMVRSHLHGDGDGGPRQGGGETDRHSHQQQLDAGQPEERSAVPLASQARDRRTPMEVSQQAQHQERRRLGRRQRAVATGPRGARIPQSLGDRDQSRAGEGEVGTQGQGAETRHRAGQEGRLGADVQDQSQQTPGPEADGHHVDHEGRHHDVVSRCRGGVPGHGAGQQAGHRDDQQHTGAGGRPGRTGRDADDGGQGRRQAQGGAGPGGSHLRDRPAADARHRHPGDVRRRQYQLAGGEHRPPGGPPPGGGRGAPGGRAETTVCPSGQEHGGGDERADRPHRRHRGEQRHDPEPPPGERARVGEPLGDGLREPARDRQRREARAHGDQSRGHDDTRSGAPGRVRALSGRVRARRTDPGSPHRHAVSLPGPPCRNLQPSRGPCGAGRPQGMRKVPRPRSSDHEQAARLDRS